jgi:hypothetical protein
VQEGSGIKTASGELSKITPRTRKDAPEDKASRFADLIKVQCIDVARRVIGSYAMEVVPAGKTAPRPWGASAGDDLASHVAATVRDGQSTGAETGAGNESDRPGTTVAKDYGTALREHPGEADAAAQAMGINNYAQPDVGEAFATLSIGSDDKIDYATAEAGQTSTDRSDKDVWNYHFAGVVARSLDATDWVTLENYTRNQQAENALKELKGKLLEDYQKKTKGWLFNKDGKEPKGQWDSDKVTEMIKELGKASKEEARKEYQALGMDQMAWQRKWFFRMYGSKVGQRFHEQQYKSGQGDFVNPLTVRVRAARQTPDSSG